MRGWPLLFVLAGLAIAVWGAEAASAGHSGPSYTLDSIATADVDGDGYVETLHLSFSEPIDWTTLDASEFDVSLLFWLDGDLYAVPQTVASAVPTGSSDLRLDLVEWRLIGTTGMGGYFDPTVLTLESSTGKAFHGDYAGTTFVDGAAPVIMSAQYSFDDLLMCRDCTPGQSLMVFFSEPMDEASLLPPDWPATPASIHVEDADGALATTESALAWLDVLFVEHPAGSVSGPGDVHTPQSVVDLAVTGGTDTNGNPLQLRAATPEDPLLRRALIPYVGLGQHGDAVRCPIARCTLMLREDAPSRFVAGVSLPAYSPELYPGGGFRFNASWGAEVYPTPGDPLSLPYVGAMSFGWPHGSWVVDPVGPGTRDATMRFGFGDIDEVPYWLMYFLLFETWFEVQAKVTDEAPPWEPTPIEDLTVNEGDDFEVIVAATQAPSDDVEVTVTHWVDPDSDILDIRDTRRTFTPSNWTTPFAVALTAVDNQATGNNVERLQVIWRINDGWNETVWFDEFTITILDNDGQTGTTTTTTTTSPLVPVTRPTRAACPAFADDGQQFLLAPGETLVYRLRLGDSGNVPFHLSGAGLAHIPDMSFDAGGMTLEWRPQAPGSYQGTVRLASTEGACKEELKLSFEAAWPDADEDGVPDHADNCPSIANEEQENEDADRWGDACQPSAGDNDIDDTPDAPGGEADDTPAEARGNGSTTTRPTDGRTSATTTTTGTFSVTTTVALTTTSAIPDDDGPPEASAIDESSQDAAGVGALLLVAGTIALASIRRRLQ